MNRLLPVVFGLLLVLFSVSAQSAFIDFESGQQGIPCADYINDIASGFSAVNSGTAGTGEISDTFIYFPPADGLACLFPPGDEFSLIAGDQFTAISFSALELVIEVYDGETLLDSDAIFNGTYSYNDGTFDRVTIRGSGSSPYVDNINLTLADVAEEDEYQGPPRLNQEDVAAPVALFCYPEGGVDIYTVVDSEGTFLTRAFPADIIRARQQARSSSTNTAIYNDGSISLWILNTGEMQVNAGKYISIFNYEAVCGPLPDVTLAPPTATPRPQNEFTIINRPR